MASRVLLAYSASHKLECSGVVSASCKPISPLVSKCWRINVLQSPALPPLLPSRLPTFSAFAKSTFPPSGHCHHLNMCVSHFPNHIDLHIRHISSSQLPLPLGRRSGHHRDGPRSHTVSAADLYHLAATKGGKLEHSHDVHSDSR